MNAFPDEHHLSSQAWVSLGNVEDACKKSSRITYGDIYLKTFLVELARAATRTYLRTKYDSLAGRRGKERALIEVGYKILCT